MRLALFSKNIHKQHLTKLVNWTTKSPGQTTITYISTAANPYLPERPQWLLESMEKLQTAGFILSEVDISQGNYVQETFSRQLDRTDLLFISGGNIFYLMYWIRKRKLSELIIKYITGDRIFGGASAGAVCLQKDIQPFSLIDNPGEAPAEVRKGLGLVNFALIPHWGSEKYQRKLDEVKRVYERVGTKVFPINDEQAIFVENSDIEKV